MYHKLIPCRSKLASTPMAMNMGTDHLLIPPTGAYTKPHDNAMQYNMNPYNGLLKLSRLSVCQCLSVCLSA